MRCPAPLLALFLAAATGPGCTADCGPPDRYNAQTYRVFANPVTWESSNPVFTEGPDFWSYGVPSNGLGEWQFIWNGAEVGPVTVRYNGQEFSGTGEMHPTECGSATLDFSGEYVDPRTEVSHVFNAKMSLTLWTETLGGKLAGFVVWKESWTHPSNTSGTFTANSHLSGDLIGGG